MKRAIALNVMYMFTLLLVVFLHRFWHWHRVPGFFWSHSWRLRTAMEKDLFFLFFTFCLRLWMWKSFSFFLCSSLFTLASVSSQNRTYRCWFCHHWYGWIHWFSDHTINSDFNYREARAKVEKKKKKRKEVTTFFEIGFTLNRIIEWFYIWMHSLYMMLNMQRT